MIANQLAETNFREARKGFFSFLGKAIVGLGSVATWNLDQARKCTYALRKLEGAGTGNEKRNSRPISF